MESRHDSCTFLVFLIIFRFYTFINFLGKQKQRQRSGNKKDILYIDIHIYVYYDVKENPKKKKKKKIKSKPKSITISQFSHIAADVNAQGGRSVGKRFWKVWSGHFASFVGALGAQTGGVAINIIEL